MAKHTHVSETPATAFLKAKRVAYSEHPYEYLEHGGARHSADALGFDPYTVVKTLVMQDDKGAPLLVLMHGNRTVSTKNLARQIGVKSVEPCTPETASRHSGYLVGGTSPLGTKKAMPVHAEATIFDLPRIYLNGGSRGFLVALDPTDLEKVLKVKRVSVAIP